MKLWREHYLNVLHLYCRLRDIGIGKTWAMRTARVLAWKIPGIGGLIGVASVVLASLGILLVGAVDFWKRRKFQKGVKERLYR